jgi:hypothetical protein
MLEPLLQQIVPMVSASLDLFLLLLFCQMNDSADLPNRLMALGGGAARGAAMIFVFYET